MGQRVPVKTNPNGDGNGDGAGIISVNKWLKDIGRTDTTFRRWTALGWLSPFYISTGE